MSRLHRLEFESRPKFLRKSDGTSVSQYHGTFFISTSAGTVRVIAFASIVFYIRKITTAVANQRDSSIP